MQRASLQHERARPFTHRKQFGFEPELANQLERRRFGIEDGVGSRFDRESAGVLRLNQSARARRRFPHAHPDSALRQFVGGSEPADPRANDRDRQRLVGHCCWRLATGYWQLVTGNWLLACTCRASACTFSSEVFGRMPWPRLNTWPARPAARRSTSSAAANRPCVGPSRRVGSRLPWMPRSWPITSHASSSGRRQSTPITSPPAAFISGRMASVLTPKWIVGTPDPARASKIRFVCGSAYS